MLWYQAYYGNDVLMYVTPLFSIKQAITTNNFNAFNAAFCLVNGIYWVLYGLIDPIDVYVLVGNSVGVLSATVQLVLYWKGKNLPPLYPVTN